MRQDSKKERKNWALNVVSEDIPSDILLSWMNSIIIYMPLRYAADKCNSEAEMLERRDVLKFAGVLMGMGVLRPNISEAFSSPTQDADRRLYHARILDGNRLSIPGEFRKMFSETLYITSHIIDCCLQIFPEAEWQRIQTQSFGD